METRDARKRVEEDRQRTIYSSIQCTEYEVRTDISTAIGIVLYRELFTKTCSIITPVFNEDNHRSYGPQPSLRPEILYTLYILDLCTWRRTSWRRIHRFSRLWMIRIRRLLQLNPGLHPAKVAIVLSIILRIGRRILRRRLRWIVRVPVKRLIRRRRPRRRSHPVGANMRSETTSSTATSVEASIDFPSVFIRFREFRKSRERDTGRQRKKGHTLRERRRSKQHRQ